MLAPPFEVRRFAGFDGTDLAYQANLGSLGERPLRSRPALVLANGLGGTGNAWTPLFRHFDRDYRIVSWDYRGLYRSSLPKDARSAAPLHQALDLEALLEHTHIRRAVFIGWSMGVQVLLEHYRRAPDTVAGLVLINGVAGHPFKTALPLPLAEQLVIRPLLALMEKRGAQATGMLRWAIGRRELLPVLRAIGFFGEASETDPELITDMVAQFGDLDLEFYGNTLRLLGAHDATDVLATLRVPVQIITGARDLMTPRKTAEEMRKRIPDARLLMVADGSHYTPVELPHIVNPCIADFLLEIGHVPERATARTAN